MFLDDPNLGDLALSADFVFVFGNLTIGSPDQHFRSAYSLLLFCSVNEYHLFFFMSFPNTVPP